MVSGIKANTKIIFMKNSFSPCSKSFHTILMVRGCKLNCEGLWSSVHGHAACVNLRYNVQINCFNTSGRHGITFSLISSTTEK